MDTGSRQDVITIIIMMMKRIADRQLLYEVGSKAQAPWFFPACMHCALAPSSLTTSESGVRWRGTTRWESASSR